MFTLEVKVAANQVSNRTVTMLQYIKRHLKPSINLQFICLLNKIIAYINIYFYFHFSN